MKYYFKWKREQIGQSIVEFSLMIPVFLLIMMFAIEICFGVYYKMVLNHLLIDVARVVSVSSFETPTQLNNKIQSLLTSYQSQGALLFRTKDASLFSVSWTIQTIDVLNQKVITVKARYTGVRLPFIGTLPVSDQLIYPYVSY
jgi:Flp pilus assembly protein TadG